MMPMLFHFFFFFGDGEKMDFFLAGQFDEVIHEFLAEVNVV